MDNMFNEFVGIYIQIVHAKSAIGSQYWKS